MSDELLAAMHDSPVPPLAPAQRVRARGEQRRRRRRAVLAGAGAALVVGVGGTAYGLSTGGGTPERLQVAAAPTPAPSRCADLVDGPPLACPEAVPVPVPGATSPPPTPAQAPSGPATGRPSTPPPPAGSSPRVSAPPAPPTASPTADPTASPAPTRAAFPPAASPEHGGRYWAVYLAVIRDDAGARGEQRTAVARAQATAAGYAQALGGGDVGCDQGAREALGLDPARGYVTLSLFFDTQEQARQFVDAYEPGVVGIAQVTAFCLD